MMTCFLLSVTNTHYFEADGFLQVRDRPAADVDLPVVFALFFSDESL